MLESIDGLLNHECPHCGHDGAWKLSQSPNKRKCKNCKRYFSITGQTELHHGRLPLEKYNEILILAAAGHSRLAISKLTGLNYKTVWSRLKQFGAPKHTRAGRKPWKLAERSAAPDDEVVLAAIAELEREVGRQKARDRLQRRIAKARAGIEPRRRPKPLPYTRGFDQD